MEEKGRHLFPTVKQNALFHKFQETGFDGSKLSSCMREAGYSDSTIMGSGRKKVYSSIQHRVTAALEEAGLTDEKLAKEHKRLAFKSMHPKYNEQPNDPVRLRAIEMAHQLKDNFPAKKLDIDKTEEITVSIDTIRKAAECSGETYIDVIPEEEKPKERQIVPL